MHDWLFSDMVLLFFATWSVMVAAVSYAAFIRDLHPSMALTRRDAVSSVTPRNAGAR